MWLEEGKVVLPRVSRLLRCLGLSGEAAEIVPPFPGVATSQGVTRVEFLGERELFSSWTVCPAGEHWDIWWEPSQGPKAELL